LFEEAINAAAPAYELMHRRFARRIEGRVQEHSRGREQFYRLSLESLEQWPISAIKWLDRFRNALSVNKPAFGGIKSCSECA
jgi:hypothetical protein